MGTLARDDFYENASPAANFHGLKTADSRATKYHGTAIISQLQDEMTLMRSMRHYVFQKKKIKNNYSGIVSLFFNSTYFYDIKRFIKHVHNLIRYIKKRTHDLFC